MEKKLGFESIDFSTTYFPKYIFKYISSGGNAAMQCESVMDIPNLNRFVNYLSQTIKFKKKCSWAKSTYDKCIKTKNNAER